jgi:hypothetical protein
MKEPTNRHSLKPGTNRNTSRARAFPRPWFIKTWHKVLVVSHRLIENPITDQLWCLQGGDKLATSAQSVSGFDVLMLWKLC